MSRAIHPASFFQGVTNFDRLARVIACASSPYFSASTAMTSKDWS